MDTSAKLRPMYIAKILYEQTDDNHFLTTPQIESILRDDYGIDAYRKTIKSDVYKRQAG